MPSLLMIHEVVGPNNAIGKVAMSDVRIALENGYRVTVIAKILCPSLQKSVTWHPLYVPARGFLLQWTTARTFIKRALACAVDDERRMEGKPFDIIHAHQPQAASLADVFQCHFLTRAAHERKCLENRTDIRSRLMRLQEIGVLHAEDYYYRRWNPRTHMLYNSAFTRHEFHRLYQPCPLEAVLPCEFPPLRLASEQERLTAKKRIFGEVPATPVAGYLGGLVERKGYRRLFESLRTESDITLLLGGPGADRVPEEFSTGKAGPHVKAVGLVGDTATFYAACDVLIVPSLFEPLGLVAFEAAARGVPVIAARDVGALPHLLEFHAGEEWDPAHPAELPRLIRHAAAHRAGYQHGIECMSTALNARAYGKQLLSTYQQVLDRAHHHAGVPCPAG